MLLRIVNLISFISFTSSISNISSCFTFLSINFSFLTFLFYDLYFSFQVGPRTPPLHYEIPSEPPENYVEFPFNNDDRQSDAEPSGSDVEERLDNAALDLQNVRHIPEVNEQIEMNPKDPLV